MFKISKIKLFILRWLNQKTETSNLNVNKKKNYIKNHTNSNKIVIKHNIKSNFYDQKFYILTFYNFCLYSKHPNLQKTVNMKTKRNDIYLNNITNFFKNHCIYKF